MIKNWLLLTSFLIHSTFAAEFKLDHKIALEGDEGWYYLSIDVTTNHLFITRSNHIDVLDLTTEKVVGKITEKINGAHGVAFAPTLNKGYATSGKSSSVIAFDLKTLAVLKEIPAGKKADLVLFDEITKRVFSFNGEDKTITIIDATTDKVIKTLSLDGKPEFGATDNQGRIYFNNEDKNSVVELDTKEMKIIQSWPLKNCHSPTGLSANFNSHLLFSTCDNEIMAVSNTKKGNSELTIPIGKGPDASVFDDNLVFSSNGAGSITIAKAQNENDLKVVQTLPTQKGARTMIIDPRTHIVYTIAAKYEEINPKQKETRPKIIPGTVELLVIKPVK